MENLHLPHSKLFFVIAEQYKIGKINEAQKIQLKEMVIKENPLIFKVLENYIISGNEAVFNKEIIALVVRNYDAVGIQNA